MIDFDKVQGQYWRDILAQPGALRDTADGLETAPSLESVRANLQAGRLRRVVLTGMGGSWQILYPLQMRLVAEGFDCHVAETSELMYSMPSLLDSRTVVIAVSQSGASAEIVRLAQRKGPLYIGITNTPDSPLAQSAHMAVLTRAGEEGGVACKTSLASISALYWAGESLAGASDPEALSLPVRDVADLVEAYVSRWREHVEALSEMLVNARRVFLVGRGISMAAARLGAMLQKEAAHFHGEGMGSAALRHGPFEMLGPDSFVVVYEGDATVSALNRALVADVAATGAGVALCGVSGEGPFALPASPEPLLQPILELLPAQMMSLALAAMQGREPGKFERITKVTTTE